MRFSIVIPAYNAAATLPRALSALAAQDYPAERMEVIVVDDGSSDGTADIARGYVDRLPNLVVESLPENSGNPSAPRNRGIELVTGEFVFFHDADDWLGPEAVRRMLAHAVEWDSDVLLVKMVGEGGREVPRSMFLSSQPHVEPFRSKVVWTLAPLKLFRRELVASLRFPDFMPEDISFALRAYGAAGTVSIASDYAYYHVAAERAGASASLSTWDDPDTNLRAYEDIFGLVAEDERMRRCGALMRRLFGRDVYRTLTTIAGEDDAVAKLHLNRLIDIAGPFYDAKELETLAPEQTRLLAMAFEETPEVTELPASPYAPNPWEQAVPAEKRCCSVTVITPACNSELHLTQCLSSLEAQQVADAEFILIDDGSTDSTLRIMEDFAGRDSRFRIVSRENRGYGASMNEGLALARGRYVGILESDDWLEQGALEKLLAIAAAQGEPDIVKANHFVFDDTTGEERLLENYPRTACGQLVSPSSGGAADALILSVPAIWAALYRTDFLVGNKIGFLETPGASYQDTGFVFKAWAAATRAYLTSGAFVHYRAGNEGSSTVSRAKVGCVIDEWDSIDAFTEAFKNRTPHLAALLAAKKFQTFDWNIKRIAPEHIGGFAKDAQPRLARERVEGALDRMLYTDAQWRRLDKWIDDPEGLVLDIRISGENSPAVKNALRAVRRLRNALVTAKKR